MVRYSLLRLLIFFGCLGLLWLLGLRERSEQPWLLVGAALLSMVISFFVLRPFRDQYVHDLAAKVEKRTAAKARRSTDEAVEDAELRDPAPEAAAPEPHRGPAADTEFR